MVGDTSILNDVKDAIGLVTISNNTSAFDSVLITYINTAFAVLSQLGSGSSTPFTISDNTKTWSDYTTDVIEQSLVKSYICLKVSALFDPPSSSSVLTAMNNQIDELGVRINYQKDV